MENTNVILDEKDLHCITRILQSLMYEGKYFFGCQYCDYREGCARDGTRYFDEARKKLAEVTGLYTDKLYKPDNPGHFFGYRLARSFTSRNNGQVSEVVPHSPFDTNIESIYGSKTSLKIDSMSSCQNSEEVKIFGFPLEELGLRIACVPNTEIHSNV